MCYIWKKSSNTLCIPSWKGTRATLTCSELRYNFQSEKFCSSQSKSFLCFSTSLTAAESSILVNIYYLLHPEVITWCFCSGCSISLRTWRYFCQQLSCTGLTGTKPGDHRWHMPGPLPRAGHRHCSLHHEPHFCSTGTQLPKPNRL